MRPVVLRLILFVAVVVTVDESLLQSPLDVFMGPGLQPFLSSMWTDVMFFAVAWLLPMLAVQ